LCSVDAYDSFLEFKVAITRTGDPLNPHSAAYYDKKAFGGKLNKLPAWTRDQALRGQTINAARWLKIDKDVGSLEVGKLADREPCSRSCLLASDDAAQ
jgi:predicted amidohydrolase YtcJ